MLCHAGSAGAAGDLPGKDLLNAAAQQAASVQKAASEAVSAQITESSSALGCSASTSAGYWPVMPWAPRLDASM